MALNIILFDDKQHSSLLPFTYTRPAADIRVGILTIREKWEKILGATVSSFTVDYLSKKYPVSMAVENIWIFGALLPTPDLINAIMQLSVGEALLFDGEMLAAKPEPTEKNALELPIFSITEEREFEGTVSRLNHPFDIFLLNEQELNADFALLCRNRQSAPLSDTNLLIGDPQNLFIEEGAVIEGATLNCQSGIIYIGKEAEIMENSAIRGPFALCEHAVVKMQSAIDGATTVGPYCKVGGELHNVVFFGYSNKAHDGYLGNSVIGEWCNLGAATNASNLKNNYSTIDVWDIDRCQKTNSKLQFCGLMMGDHSKCGIQSMFNSGTVTGVGCNLFGTGYHNPYIPSFSYGNAQNGYETYRFDKFVEATKIVFSRRNKVFDEIEEEILRFLYDRLPHTAL
ncbi:MAG: glucose-1-phosphate thymidylyltransferase [Bacteroidales bacterium]|nr:glucose-1-phosphate thymidylyltransferase [Bacteroidales bacterium]